MAKRRLGRTEMTIEPLVLGTNVIGGTIDEPTSFAVLDAFVGEGFTAIDTADVYTKSNSERIIGNWVKARGNRLDFNLCCADVGVRPQSSQHH